MALIKQPVMVNLLGLDTFTGAKRLQPGRMTIAQNVRQRNRGVYGKRDGWTSYAKTTDSGSIASCKGLVSASGALLIRTSDSVFAYDSVRAIWLNRGLISNTMPSYVPAQANGYKPSQLSTSFYTWHFAGVNSNAAATNPPAQRSWTYRVVDKATGAEIVTSTAIPTATGWQAKAVSASGNIWLFIGLSGVGRNIMHTVKFDTATPTNAPVVTTYYTDGSGFPTDAWDVMGIPGGAVVAGFTTAGGTHWINKLDTATGGVLASPGTVTFAPGWNADSANYGASFLKNDNAGASYYLVARQAAGTWRGCIFNSTTLAFSNTPGIVILNAGDSVVSGYRDTGTGTISLFVSAPAALPETSIVTTRTCTSAYGAFTSAVLKRGVNVFGEPVQVGSTWYLPVQHDDNAAAQQRSYALLDAGTGRIMARTMYGLGGDVYQHASAATANAFDYGWIAPVVVSGNVISLDGSSFDGTLYTSMALSFDLAATLGPSEAFLQGNGALLPSGWMTYFGGSVGSEFIGMFPRNVVVTNGGGAGTPPAGIYSVAVCYAYRDRLSGAIFRSAPSATFTITNPASISVQVPTNRLTNSLAADQLIEVYISVAGQTTMFRQGPINNDPTVDSITAIFGPAAPATVNFLTGTEILYTQSGELANDPPPPCRLVAIWNRRVFLSGTDVQGEVWPSKEIQVGLGPAFSLGLVFNIPGDTGHVTAMGAIDYNYFAIFKKDGIWVIPATPSPDASGRGAYEPIRLSGDRGCTVPASMVQAKAGLFFQDGDGKIILLDNSLNQIEQVQDGMYGFRGQAVTGAVNLPNAQQLRFYLADGTALVLDYGVASETNPYGEWSVDTNTAGTGAACLHNGVPHFADTAGLVSREVIGQFFDGASTAILRKIRLPLTLQGVRGFFRVYRGQVVGQWASQHTLKVTYDVYSGAPGEAGSTSQNWSKVISAGPELVEFRPDRGRVSIFDVTVEDTGSDLGQGGTLDGLAFEVGILPGLPRVNNAQKF